MPDRGSGMRDPYKETWESIAKALSEQSKMVLWIAERTLSAKDFNEFVDEFAKETEDKYAVEKELIRRML